MSQAAQQVREELTSLVQRRRADFLRLKGAGSEISRAELSEASAAYEQALVCLSQFFEQAEDHPSRRAHEPCRHDPPNSA